MGFNFQLRPRMRVLNLFYPQTLPQSYSVLGSALNFNNQNSQGLTATPNTE
jgi:hypothetical protein